MAKYVYPAVFEPEDNGAYSVYFPDIDGCYTAGESLAEAFEMAEDALALMIYDYEQNGRTLPSASRLENVKTENGSFVNYIACDTIEYQKRYNTKAVKKTLSIPEWLNEAATKAGVNFSQVLQDALKKQLNLI